MIAPGQLRHPVRPAHVAAHRTGGPGDRVLLLTGQADPVIEPGNTLRLAARLHADGVLVTVAAYPGIDHMALMEALADPLTFLAPVRAASLTFIAGREPCGA